MKLLIKPIIYGFLATALLLFVYFFILTLVSGWTFAQDQFSDFGYYIVSLAVGFGIQIGLYTYLKHLIHQRQGQKILAVTGTTSTATMISCCAHYLTNLLPILGITGLATFVSQYQIELFWVGLAFNAGGIIYMIRTILKVKTV